MDSLRGRKAVVVRLATVCAILASGACFGHCAGSLAGRAQAGQAVAAAHAESAHVSRALILTEEETAGTGIDLDLPEYDM